eukprot:Rhum_TRINITY_DN16152_c0_g1::Rhum_TRINITY_DN16152_c0_g1_i1::g.162848::m.162848
MAQVPPEFETAVRGRLQTLLCYTTMNERFWQGLESMAAEVDEMGPGLAESDAIPRALRVIGSEMETVAKTRVGPREESLDRLWFVISYFLFEAKQKVSWRSHIARRYSPTGEHEVSCGELTDLWRLIPPGDNAEMICAEFRRCQWVPARVVSSMEERRDPYIAPTVQAQFDCEFEYWNALTDSERVARGVWVDEGAVTEEDRKAAERGEPRNARAIIEEMARARQGAAHEAQLVQKSRPVPQTQPHIEVADAPVTVPFAPVTPVRVKDEPQAKRQRREFYSNTKEAAIEID